MRRIYLSNVYSNLMKFVSLENPIKGNSTINPNLKLILTTPEEQLITINDIVYNNCHIETVPHYDINLLGCLKNTILQVDVNDISLETFRLICIDLFRYITGITLNLEDEIFNILSYTKGDLIITNEVFNLLELKIVYSLLSVIVYRLCLYDRNNVDIILEYENHIKFLMWTDKLINQDSEQFSSILDEKVNSILSLVEDSPSILNNINKCYSKLVIMGNGIYNNTFTSIDKLLNRIQKKLEYQYKDFSKNFTLRTEKALRFPEFNEILELIKALSYTEFNELMNVIDYNLENLTNKNSFKYNIYNILKNTICIIQNKTLDFYRSETPIDLEYTINTIDSCYAYKEQNCKPLLKVFRITKEIIDLYYTTDINQLLGYIDYNGNYMAGKLLYLNIDTDYPLLEKLHSLYERAFIIDSKKSGFNDKYAINIDINELSTFISLIKFIMYTTLNDSEQLQQLGITNYTLDVLATNDTGITSKELANKCSFRFSDYIYDKDINNLLYMQQLVFELASLVNHLGLSDKVQKIYSSEFEFKLYSKEVELHPNCYPMTSPLEIHNRNYFYSFGDTPLSTVIANSGMTTHQNRQIYGIQPYHIRIDCLVNRFVSDNYYLTSPIKVQEHNDIQMPEYKIDTTFGGGYNGYS